MFGSETLEIAIGLVLVFLLVSLMLTAVTEAIEAMLKTRAADLERAIGLLLDDPKSAEKLGVEEFYKHPLIFSLFKGSYRRRTKRWWLLNRETGGDMPSYIPRDLFSTAALDLYKNGKAGPGLELVIEKLAVAYGFDPKTDVGAGAARVKVQLESWYDGVMDRASGWYKRRAHKLLFWLGLVTAIVLNINPIAITQYLAQNPQARDQLAQMASQVAAVPQNQTQVPAASDAAAGDAENAASRAADAADKATSAPAAAEETAETANVDVAAKVSEEAKAAADAVGDAAKPRVACAERGAEWEDVIACQEAIAQVGLPIGWSEFAWDRTFPGFEAPTGPKSAIAAILAVIFNAPGALIIALLGWGITGLAATLGAPFWFDVLNKIMVIRSTVKPREKSGDEASEDRTRKVEPVAQQEETNPAPTPTVAPHSDEDGAVG